MNMNRRLEKLNQAAEKAVWRKANLVTMELKKEIKRSLVTSGSREVPFLEKVKVDVTKSGPGSKTIVESYLIQDPNNARKYHHIKVDRENRWYYNQAIEYDTYGLADFYADELLDPEYQHGYQWAIDQAQGVFLSAGDTIPIYRNQGYRYLEIIATNKREALGYYAMPQGRMSLIVVDRYDREFLRNVSPRKIPAKWFGLAQANGWHLSALSVEIANSI